MQNRLIVKITTTQLPFVLIALLPITACKTDRADELANNAPTDEPLFKATPLTADGLFTKGIEGPACDRAGNIYAVNFAREQTIGKVTPAGEGEVFVQLPGKSTGNGIVY